MLCGVLIAATFAAGPLGAREVTFRVEPEQDLEIEPIQVRLEVAPRGAAASAAEPASEAVVVELETRRPRTLSLSESSTWVAQASAAGYWSPQVVIAPGDEGRQVVLPLFPEGEILARLEVARFGEVPGEVEVRFEPEPRPGAPGAQPRGSMECPVVERRVRCALPSGRLDLRFSAVTFAPAYRPGVPIEPGGLRELAPLVLVQGASVSGFVETEGGDPAPEGTRVRLEIGSPRAAPDVATARRLDRLGFRTVTDSRGFFHLKGVRPGQYRLEAEADGYAPARVEPVEAREDLETVVIDPLVLSRPVELALYLTPVKDPSGKPWTIRLARIDPGLDRAVDTVEGPASADGEWRQDEMAPGTYEVVVEGSGGTWWHRERFDVGPESRVLQVDLPLIEVEGLLLKGGEPARGRLWFGTSHGERRIVFDVDRDGRFAGLLPGPGEWPLEWQPEEPEAPRISLDAVDVPDRPRASLEIEVPDTLVTGEVSDERGRPVPSATVMVSSLDRSLGPSRVETGEDGRFALPGLAPGPYGVDARKAGASSEMVHVRLAEDLDPGPLRLVLREKRSFLARVHADGKGIPGARITAWPDLGRHPGVSLVEAVSGPDGAFSIEAPASVDALNFLVMAPEHGARLARLPVADEGLTEIELDPYAGTLVLEGVGESEGSPLLVHGGSFMPLAGLIRFIAPRSVSASPDGTIAISGLDPGPYAVCIGAEALSALRSADDAPEHGCVSGWLPPLGELLLGPIARAN